MGFYVFLGLKFTIARLHETLKFSQFDWSRPALCDRPGSKRTLVRISHWTNFYTYRCACALARETKDRRIESHEEHCVFTFFLGNFHLNCVFFHFNGEEVKNCCKIREKCFPIYCSPGSMFSCLTRGADLAVLGLFKLRFLTLL